MKYLKNSNDSIRLVELEDGQIGFLAKVAPLKQVGDAIYTPDKTQAILVFYAAEKVEIKKTCPTDIEIFGQKAQSQNDSHYFPTFEAIGSNPVILSSQDVYLFSNADFRQNNPVVGVEVKRAPAIGSLVYGIRKNTQYIPLSKMQKEQTYCLLH